MQIYVLRGYRGKASNNQWLAIGAYNASDLPDGLADYLVQNGHAARLPDAPTPEEQSVEPIRKRMTESEINAPRKPRKV